MKKFNWESAIPKLRVILMVITVVMAISMIVLHWTAAYFVFMILCGLIFLLDAVREKMKHQHKNATIHVCCAVVAFIAAVYGYFRYNI